MTSHLRDQHLVSLHGRFNRLRSDHEDLSGSHHEFDYFIHFEISSNITLPVGFRTALNANVPSIAVVEDTLGGLSGDRILINRAGHYTLQANGKFGNKNDEARLQVNVHDVAGNPQTRYIADLPTGEAERNFVVNTRQLDVGQYLQLEVENTDTNSITWLGRQTDASGFTVVPSQFVIARSQGEGT